MREKKGRQTMGGEGGGRMSIIKDKGKGGEGLSGLTDLTHPNGFFHI